MRGLVYTYRQSTARKPSGYVHTDVCMHNSMLCVHDVYTIASMSYNACNV